MATAELVIAALVIAYQFRVGEDSNSIYTSVGPYGAIRELCRLDRGSSYVWYSLGKTGLILGIGMELMAFIAAQMCVRNSRSQSSHDLPTPLQYGMALKMTSNPGIFSCWSYLQYLVSKQRQQLPSFVVWIALTMGVQVLLGTTTAAANTWLHLTAKSVPW